MLLIPLIALKQEEESAEGEGEHSVLTFS